MQAGVWVTWGVGEQDDAQEPVHTPVGAMGHL